MAATKKRVKKKTVSDIHGKALIRATFNNVIVTITDT
jgi:ribosomal protein S11